MYAKYIKQVFGKKLCHITNLRNISLLDIIITI